MTGANITLLSDLLQSIGDRMRSKPTAQASLQPAADRLASGCAELMRKGGEASRIAVAEQALAAYAELDDEGKARFFRMLLEDFSADPAAVRSAYAEWETARTEAALEDLFKAVEPKRQSLLRMLNHPTGGTLQLVRMRQDLLRLMRGAPELAPLDSDFSHLLSSWFNRGFLVMRRIDWNSPAAILEKIVAYEAVHEIKDWNDLRRRLEPSDRRCYGFFHPATGDEPLIFVEVALCKGIPGTIGPLLTGSSDAAGEAADTAVFYSISNCQPGLKGVSFGNFLIKQVVRNLSQELPQIRTFVTLSPAPGFARWLAGQEDAGAQELAAELAAEGWRQDAELREALAPEVQTWAARYFVHGKTGAGLPADPVARFHLGNGASAHRTNWPADLAEGALQRAHGLMINYLYELDQIEARHEAFASEGTVACGPAVRRALRSGKGPGA
ncbi:malonyl-CoA decarboxylase [Leisingera daeponensis]|uniref:malonyl-CoA decarboxylase n=1 Tax=Leisingera daeponensis TaxID=405746 RepID=UPI0021BDD511|nr:malonyl-CoA decarboxylase [Leisingera daeponensis]